MLALGAVEEKQADKDEETMQLIMLGPPGVGKGTQAEKLAVSLGVPQFSTGQTFRDAYADGSELGKMVHSYLAEGQLVPDDIVNKLVEERLSRADYLVGFLADGFPRTLVQARMLDDVLAAQGRGIDAVIDLKLDEQELVNRLSGRRSCPKCGHTHHVQSRPPKVDGICDECGGQLQQREDDQPEAIMHRLEVYHEKTEALTSYYRDKGVLIEIDSSGDVDEVFAKIQESINNRLANGAAKVS